MHTRVVCKKSWRWNDIPPSLDEGMPSKAAAHPCSGLGCLIMVIFCIMKQCLCFCIHTSTSFAYIGLKCCKWSSVFMRVINRFRHFQNSNWGGELTWRAQYLIKLCMNSTVLSWKTTVFTRSNIMEGPTNSIIQKWLGWGAQGLQFSTILAWVSTFSSKHHWVMRLVIYNSTKLKYNSYYWSKTRFLHPTGTK